MKARRTEHSNLGGAASIKCKRIQYCMRYSCAQVPEEARCLFLPANLDDMNELLIELAESKDHPVWISRPDGAFGIQGLIYDKVGIMGASWGQAMIPIVRCLLPDRFDRLGHACRCRCHYQPSGPV
jgi:hypothetical protein